MSEPTRVADIILQQLGGNKFTVMTGSKNYLAEENTLRMHLAKNKSGANRLRITLNWNDLYSLEFYRHIPGKLNKNTLEYTNDAVEAVAEFDDVYCDQLQSIFTQVTGLYTHL